MRTGTGALAWYALRGGPLAEPAVRLGLESAYRLQMLQAAVRRADLHRLLQSLARRGIAPLLVKGPALAHLYPEPALRAYSDFDLCVDAAEAEEARLARQEAGELTTMVEIHAGRVSMLDRTLPEVMSRAVRVELEGLHYYEPSPQDHLRLVALHMLLHGGWRPIWVCDIFLFLQALPAEFPLEELLRGPAWERQALLQAMAVSVEISGSPASRFELPPPAGWLRTALIEQWNRGVGQSGAGALEPEDLSRQDRWSRLAAHWRGPLQATTELRAPWRGLPRLPVQVAATALRAPSAAARLLQVYRARHTGKTGAKPVISGAAEKRRETSMPALTEILTPDPACCTAGSSIAEVAAMMRDEDCGAIPVVENDGSRRLVGVVTDRDIVCRLVASGADPATATAGEAMTPDPATLPPDATAEECLELMATHQVRRVPVVDAAGCLIGIVSQADVARLADREPEFQDELVEAVEEISQP